MGETWAERAVATPDDLERARAAARPHQAGGGAVNDARERLESLGAARLRLEVPDVNGILRGKLVPAGKMLDGKGAGISEVLYCLTSADEVFEKPPTNVTWGHDNRNACLRAITASDSAARIQHRRPGADLNPYLAVAACVDGCRHGLEQGLEPAPEAPGRAYDDDRAAALPADLESATEALRQSELAGWRKAAPGEAAGELGDQVPGWELARAFELV